MLIVRVRLEFNYLYPVYFFNFWLFVGPIWFLCRFLVQNRTRTRTRTRPVKIYGFENRFNQFFISFWFSQLIFHQFFDFLH
jgi:hypothetical protein